MKNRVGVIHGVNLDTLGDRDPGIYGKHTLGELEFKIGEFAKLGLEVWFEQTNHEGEYCELLHRASEVADGLILNPGAWTHYSYAIRDALEVSGPLPAIEVHISEVDSREEWRQVSVIREICVGRVQGKGADGYREALELLKQEFGAA